MEKIIKSLENKFKLINEKITSLINLGKNSKVLLTELDIKEVLDITNEEYDLLVNFSNESSLKEDQIKRLMHLNDILSNQNKYIDLINHDIILKNKNITRDQIYYLLNRKNNEKDRNNVIINVNVIDKDVVKIEDILKLNKKEKE